MSKKRIVVTRRLPAQVEADLAAKYDVLLNPEDVLLTPDQILDRAVAHKADGIVVTLTDQVPEATINALPESVGIISTYSVGFNHVHIDAAKARGIRVGYAPEATTIATADTAMLLLLAACRRAHEFQMQIRSGKWGAWNAYADLGTDPEGKKLGLVGMGRIGQAVAKRCRAFDMEIHYTQRRRLPADKEQGAVYHETLESLLKTVDVVSLHTPTTPETKGFINETSLGWLKPGSIFINAARGDQVVDDALIAALQSNHIAAAGLDVFNGEPAFDKRYLDLPNVFMLPHIGTSTKETRNQMGADTIANLDAFFAGKDLPWSVV